MAKLVISRMPIILFCSLCLGLSYVIRRDREGGCWRAAFNVAVGNKYDSQSALVPVAISTVDNPTVVARDFCNLHEFSDASDCHKYMADLLQFAKQACPARAHPAPPELCKDLNYDDCQFKCLAIPCLLSQNYQPCDSVFWDHVPLNIPVAHHRSTDKEQVVVRIPKSTNMTKQTAEQICTSDGASNINSVNGACLSSVKARIALEQQDVRRMFVNIQHGQGGFHFSEPIQLLVDVLSPHIGVFLETGAFFAQTLSYVARRYPHINSLSCEPSPSHYAVANCSVAQLKAAGLNVSLHPQTSQQFMQDTLLGTQAGRHILKTSPGLVWLDAHGYGYEWPLKEEVFFFMRQLQKGGWILIDDFKVPKCPSMSFDVYNEQECSFDFIQESMPKTSEKIPYRLFYPQSTSCWGETQQNGKGLASGTTSRPDDDNVGWGLIAFGQVAHMPISQWLASILEEHQFPT